MSKNTACPNASEKVNLDKPITAATAGVKIPVPATKEAATRVDPPVTTSIALTEKTYN